MDARSRSRSLKLDEAAPQLGRLLKRPLILTPALYAVSEIRCQTVMVPMRDGVRLATDIYLPPVQPAPVIVLRTPYGRGMDLYAGPLMSFARRGYAVVSQDCRGTGDSEPDHWDYYMYEPEDGWDLVEWVSQQGWFDGFLAGCGGSYSGQTQWQMALHPKMTTIVPEVSGLGIAPNTMHLHMFANAFARSVGKGQEKVSIPFFDLEREMLEETLSTGYYNEPLYRSLPEALLTRFPALRNLSPDEARRWLWAHYCSLSCAGRTEFVRQAAETDNVTIVDVENLSVIFGQWISHDAHTLPTAGIDDLCQSIHATVMLRTGWYDWGLNDALATWALLQRCAPEPMRCRCRLIIAPSAHNMPGYHEGIAEHPELQHAHGLASNVELLLQWYRTVRDQKTDAWPKVIYYLMGANEWRTGDAWPPTEIRYTSLYLDSCGRLGGRVPGADSAADGYTYDPTDPTPTVGGSILSFVFPPGSVDVSEVQKRPDVLTFTTASLIQDVDIVGPVRVVLYVSSSAVDTDFAARLSDVFPDGRSIQLQNGVLRARYRNLEGEPEFLEPGHIYRIEIDLWATANRFRVGHKLRLDLSSADFPRFDRNANRGGDPGPPIPATQTIYHDTAHPSHLVLPVLGCWELSG